MVMEAPQTLLIATVSAFAIGWLVARVGVACGNRLGNAKGDPRDSQIRGIEAELRISRGETEKLRSSLEERDGELAESQRQVADADVHLRKQEELIASLKKDLRESVRKTRELRSELQDRATENLRSEVKLREVETELSVARASTDLIATGVLDYSVAPDAEDGRDEVDETGASTAQSAG